MNEAVALSEQRELSDLEKQGLIQGFECTHELAWKVMQDFFKESGDKKIYGSKDATRLAFKYELIEDGDIWMEMIKDRNRSSHTYNEVVANAIAEAVLLNYHNELQKFGNTMISLKNNK